MKEIREMVLAIRGGTYQRVEVKAPRGQKDRVLLGAVGVNDSCRGLDAEALRGG